MACITEALGLMPLGSATPPAVSSARDRVAEQTGFLAARLAKPKEDGGTGNLTLQTILTKASFENGVTVLQALGGSTNAIVHLLAIAGRVPGLDFTLDDIDRVGRRTPVLVNLKPAGSEYMEDFHRAGGVPTLLSVLKPLLHLDALTVTGRTLGEELAAWPHATWKQIIVRPLDDPIFPASALVVLRGNLAPRGCVMKQAASAPHLRKHTGPAVVFSSTADLAKRIDSDDLDVSADSVLVLQNIGPVGHPGMPEAGLIPIPRKLARQGVKDMLRISDGRMSGTAEGAVVLHVSPESAVGGPLAIVRDGDLVSVDTSERKIHLHVSDEEISARLSAWAEQGGEARRKKRERGYRGLYKHSVGQAETGVDFEWARADGVF
jgi:dihydroxy-acid dehydratase